MSSSSARRPQLLVTFTGMAKYFQRFLQDKCDINVGVRVKDPSAVFLTMEEVVANIAGKDVIVVMPLHPVNNTLLDLAGPQLKLVVCCSAGYEHVDLEECKKRGITVCNSKGIISKGVANLAIGLAIAVRRGIVEYNDHVKTGQWFGKRTYTLNAARVDLFNSVAGIVGLGDIGLQVMKRLIAADVSRILYCGNTRKPQAEEQGAEFVSFSDLLKRSDSLFICCAVNDSTRNMFDAEAFALMKPGSILINVSRGATVNHDALYQALTSGHLLGAGIDVTDPEPMPADHPLCKTGNCLITPHIGGFCEPVISLVVEACCDNIQAWLQGKQVANRLC